MKSIYKLLLLLFIAASCKEVITEDKEVDIIEVSLEEGRLFSNASPAIACFSKLDVSFDTNYVKANTAGLKVDLLMKNYYFDLEGDYGPQNRRRKDEPNCDFRDFLFYDFDVFTCEDGKLEIAGRIYINDTVAFLKDRLSQCEDQEKITTASYRTFHDGATLKTDQGAIEIKNSGMRCQDSGLNTVVFTNEHGVLEMGELNNVLIFQYDLNMDGLKEVYLLSYMSCAGFMEIYRIQNDKIS